MENVILVRYGEIYLKGKNRKFFEKTLENNIKNTLKDYNVCVLRIPGRYEISGFDTKYSKIIMNKLGKVAGIFSYSLAQVIDTDKVEIEKVCFEIMQDKVGTFKVVTNRADKSFEINSMELSRHIGGMILSKNQNLKVDIHDAKHVLNIDIRENKKTYIFVSSNTIMGMGGMPVSSSGHGLILLSGGIDSPVAFYMMNKRGVKLHAVHFHSYPYTSVLAKEKVLELAKTLAPYNGDEIAVYLCSMTKVQEAIHKNCNNDYMITLLRRAMLRVAEKLSKQKNFSMIVTGESLGQVASQTIESMTVVESVVNDTPMLRPLIAFDKKETIDIARRIDTYDISIRPYEDCCTVFLPDSPVTRPKLEKVLFEESKIDIELLVNEAFETIEKVVIKP